MVVTREEPPHVMIRWPFTDFNIIIIINYCSFHNHHNDCYMRRAPICYDELTMYRCQHYAHYCSQWWSANAPQLWQLYWQQQIQWFCDRSPHRHQQGGPSCFNSDIIVIVVVDDNGATISKVGQVVLIVILLLLFLMLMMIMVLPSARWAKLFWYWYCCYRCCWW